MSYILSSEYEQEFEGKSDMYKFLMSKAYSKISIPGLKTPEFDSNLLANSNQDISERRLSNVNSINVAFDQDFYDDNNFSNQLMGDEDSITIGQIENPENGEALEACILLEDASDDLWVQSTSQNNFGFNFKSTLDTLKTNMCKKIASDKSRKVSCSKSCSETVCWEHFQKDLSNPEAKNEEIKVKNDVTIKADWNYFSLRRTCFRGMSAFYKEKFSNFCKSKGTKSLLVKQASMEELVDSFIKSEFLNSNAQMNIIDTPEFLDSMITVLHSHRHKKNEDYIKTRDFTKIRQVLYSFSTAAKKTFLANKNYSLIFTHFYDCEGNEFLDLKSINKPLKFKTELKYELDTLYEAASKTVSKA